MDGYNRQTDRWMDRQMDGWMEFSDGWIKEVKRRTDKQAWVENRQNKENAGEETTKYIYLQFSGMVKEDTISNFVLLFCLFQSRYLLREEDRFLFKEAAISHK